MIYCKFCQKNVEVTLQGRCEICDMHLVSTEKRNEEEYDEEDIDFMLTGKEYRKK